MTARLGRGGVLGFGCVLLLLAIVVNAHRYLTAAGDASVGLYLYVAELWLHGHLPYLVAWEYKPPGLFAYFALALALTGERAALAVESLTTLSALATALLLWRLLPSLDGAADERAGRYAALFYVLLAPENEGYLGDAEVLLAPFLTAAMLLACTGRMTLGRGALAGLFGGCALQMKLSALPLVAVPALVLARRSRRSSAATAGMVSYAIAALVPFALEAVLYAKAGALSVFADANFGATLRRTAGLQRGIVRENLAWFGAQLRVLAPALELTTFALTAGANRQRLASWGWLAAALISIAGVGEFYDRQFVLLEAPVAALGGIGLRVAVDYARDRRVPRRFAVALAFVVTFALHDYWETAQAVGIAYHRVVLREPHYRAGEYADIVAALRRRPPGSLFVMQRSPLLYYDLGVASPTRFPYTDHLFDARLTAMTGVDGKTELARIFALKPQMIVSGKIAEPRFARAAVRFTLERLARDYHPLGRIDSQTTLYARNESGAP